MDDWGYGYIDIRNLYRFFKTNKSKATEEDCVAIIRRLDLDADSKLSKEEFLDGIRAQEPFSKMIVRDKMARKEEMVKLKKQETKKVPMKKSEDNIESNWNKQHTVKTYALDRSYKKVLSTSPLKHRVDFDVESPPKRLESSRSPRRSISRGRQTTSI